VFEAVIEGRAHIGRTAGGPDVDAKNIHYCWTFLHLAPCAAQQLAESGGDSLPVAGLAVAEPAEALHQIEGRGVNLDRIDRSPAMEPLAPKSGISGAPPPRGQFSERATKMPPSQPRLGRKSLPSLGLGKCRTRRRRL